MFGFQVRCRASGSGTVSVVIRYFHSCSSFLSPDEADAIFVVDTDRGLAISIALKFFQLVLRRALQIAERQCCLQVLELSLRDSPDCIWTGLSSCLGVLVVIHIFSPTILETDDHCIFSGTASFRLLYHLTV